MYEIPEKYYFRLHHIRPRFKNDVENVLVYMASEIAKLSPEIHRDFKSKLNNVISLYPGNASKEDKTINNWRTEISSLFGLIEYDESISKPGRMSLLLAESQDLIEFFRYFLFYFQYPGGHLKPMETWQFIKTGIKFKPAKYLIQVMLEGTKMVEDEKFGISKAEATHCIFNDLRVTRDGRSAKETVELILRNRENDVVYDQGGDITRYAGDILDYMELADLVKLRQNYKYYPNTVHIETLQAFINDETYFQPYEPLYGKPELSLTEIAETQQDWFKYVNNQLDTKIFEADITSIIEEAGEMTEDEDQSRFIKEVLEKIQRSRASEDRIKTKEVGDIGEAIIIQHEKARLVLLRREDILHLVQKIPETYAVGYDIGSYDGDGDLRRYIEVKTTVSRGRLASKNFHMTPSEWSAASTNGNTYYVYRLMISSQDVSLFLIQDPVGKYKKDLLNMIPRNGADITYTEKSGHWEKLLA